MIHETVFIHHTADVSADADVGAGTHVWRFACVREGARVGEQCTIGQGVYIDPHVSIGSRVKVQTNTAIFEGVTIEDGVFIGPHVCFTNDLHPRATTPDGRPKRPEDWEMTPTLVRQGASIGAGSVIRCGTTIGAFALVGAGAVVTRDVPSHVLVIGNPARPHGYVCRCARRLIDVVLLDSHLEGTCPACGHVRVNLDTDDSGMHHGTRGC